MISFRVSDEEFELLKLKSAAEGARSISDYARQALCEPANTSADTHADIERLSEEIQQLSVEVRRTTALLEMSRASSPPRPRMALAPGKSNRGV